MIDFFRNNKLFKLKIPIGIISDKLKDNIGGFIAGIGTAIVIGAGIIFFVL